MITGQVILALAALLLIGSIILVAQLDKKNDLLKMQAKKEGLEDNVSRETDKLRSSAGWVSWIRGFGGGSRFFEGC